MGYCSTRFLAALLLTAQGHADAEVVDVMIVGGGISGLSTARAAAKLGLSTVVLEQGTICGQGATAAAKQGQVNAFEPNSKDVFDGWDDSFRFRWASLQIYQEMEAMGYDVGLVQHGGGQVYLEDSTLLETLSVKLQWWLNLQALRLGKSTSTTHETALPYAGLWGLGLLHDARKAHVTPCKVLAAWRNFTEARRGEVLEGARLTSIELTEGGLWTANLGSLGMRQARALVLAVGTWHNHFVSEHLPACAGLMDVTAVAGQIAIYNSVQPPIEAHAPIVDLSDSPWATAGIVSQAAHTSDCPWAASGGEAFLTECNGVTFAHYLYATQWNGTTFSSGTRRAPIEEPARCWGDSWEGGGEPGRGYYALGVPYDSTLEAWALDAAVHIDDMHMLHMHMLHMHMLHMHMLHMHMLHMHMSYVHVYAHVFHPPCMHTYDRCVSSTWRGQVTRRSRTTQRAFPSHAMARYTTPSSIAIAIACIHTYM